MNANTEGNKLSEEEWERLRDGALHKALIGADPEGPFKAAILRLCRLAIGRHREGAPQLLKTAADESDGFRARYALASYYIESARSPAINSYFRNMSFAAYAALAACDGISRTAEQDSVLWGTYPLAGRKHIGELVRQRVFFEEVRDFAKGVLPPDPKWIPSDKPEIFCDEIAALPDRIISAEGRLRLRRGRDQAGLVRGGIDRSPTPALEHLDQALLLAFEDPHPYELSGFAGSVGPDNPATARVMIACAAYYRAGDLQRSTMLRNASMLTLAIITALDEERSATPNRGAASIQITSSDPGAADWTRLKGLKELLLKGPFLTSILEFGKDVADGVLIPAQDEATFNRRVRDCLDEVRGLKQAPDQTQRAQERAAGLPELNGDQRTLLETIFSLRRETGVWPKKVKVKVELLKQKIMLDDVVKSLPWRLFSRPDSPGEDERIGLSIFGYHYFPEEKPAVDVYLRMLRLGARSFIESPRGEVYVTSDQLRSMLGELNIRDDELISELVRDGLPWGGSRLQSGEWRSQLGVTAFRYERVGSLPEVLTLFKRRGEESFTLTSEHLELLKLIYRHWKKQGVWPNALDLIISLREQCDVLYLLETLSSAFHDRQNWVNHTDNPVILRVDGLAAIKEAGGDLDSLARIIGLIADDFGDTAGDPPMTVNLLCERSVLDLPTVQKLLVLAEHASFGNVRVQGKGDTATLRVHEHILSFAGIRDFDSFERALSKESRRSYMAKEITPESLKRGLLELFAARTSDEGKHLNRINVLGRPIQPGDLEGFMNTKLNKEQRALAGRVLAELENSGLIVPTYSDIASPKDWLQITKEGQAALKEKAIKTTPEDKIEYAAFLCHASEDKKAVAIPFSDLMKAHSLTPWIDKAEIGWGDSLVRSIELGLTRSHFVIVFISPSFLKKEWAEKELRAAMALESVERKVVLPVILGLDHKTLQESHPFLAEKMYLSIKPYDQSSVVSNEQLRELLDALKQELDKRK